MYVNVWISWFIFVKKHEVGEDDGLLLLPTFVSLVKAANFQKVQQGNAIKDQPFPNFSEPKSVMAAWEPKSTNTMATASEESQMKKKKPYWRKNKNPENGEEKTVKTLAKCLSTQTTTDTVLSTDQAPAIVWASLCYILIIMII